MEVRITLVGGEIRVINCVKYKCDTFGELMERVFRDGFIMDVMTKDCYNTRSILRLEGY